LSFHAGKIGLEFESIPELFTLLDTDTEGFCKLKKFCRLSDCNKSARGELEPGFAKI